ncbi:MAG TPA: GNAT family N-acetyltransferase [Kofleriaceae bacterium]|nr:GNAT family N-acetyltransferase [Kofleriaceae bacterium]
MTLTWHDRAFLALTVSELYAILALRDQVFVVEQKCIYLEADGYDPPSRHLWATGADGAIHAYLRILPPGAKFAEASLGRVLVAPVARGTGLGKELMRRGLAAVGPVAVRIAAQAYLERFYNELGFHRVADPYDEDGIAHVDMIRPA